MNIPSIANVEQRVAAEVWAVTRHDDGTSVLEVCYVERAENHLITFIMGRHDRHLLADLVGAAIPAARRIALCAAPDALARVVPLDLCVR
jgi:hypothetical protein